MLPIGSTFSKFRRLVRDLSAELGKDIELTTEGAETELDKTVIDRLYDPLVHLIRNGIDHGIESPSGRRAAGKPARGRIRLSASHAGPNVLIRISDDGRGFDREAISPGPQRKVWSRPVRNLRTRRSSR
jgi:two-component system chemotaxis sensor kinase CheA